MTVKITRLERTAEDLRREAAKSRDADAARRMLGLALVMDGRRRSEAAQACGMDRQTLRDWVHRYNAEGLGGLSDRPHAGGPSPKLTGEQKAEVAEWVRRGPRPEEVGIVRWRLCDLRGQIATRFSVHLHECSIGRLLRGLGFSRVSVRPRHPKADAAAQEAHKKTFPRCSPQAFPMRPAASRSSCGGKMRPGSASKAA